MLNAAETALKCLIRLKPSKTPMCSEYRLARDCVLFAAYQQSEKHSILKELYMICLWSKLSGSVPKPEIWTRLRMQVVFKTHKIRIKATVSALSTGAQIHTNCSTSRNIQRFCSFSNNRDFESVIRCI